jgi:xylan 1,4-beta-xylosidase
MPAMRTCLTAVLVALITSIARAADPLPVTITVDAAHPVGPLRPVWRFFGYDEANYTYMPNGTQLVGELASLGTPDAPVFVRCHHLLTSGDAVPGLKWSSTNAYTEDAAGRPVYDWTVTDRIFDTYVKAGARPYVEVGFTPEAMSTNAAAYPHDPPREVPLSPKMGQAWPPKDYGKWGELVYQWARHCADRYGADAVRGWYWEVWNEPNIEYWQGSRGDYFKLYDVTVDAVRRAVPRARVGGPETAGGRGGTFLHEFLQHCADAKVPLDFVSFHAKGRPRFVDGHVRMAMGPQLGDVDGACREIGSFPQFARLPIVIGESDPEGCAACRGPQNGYRNGTMYSSYEAASLPQIMDIAAARGTNLEGNLTWAFEFENEPYFAGFRALATNGIDLPVLNVFRLWSQMHGQRLAVASTAGHTAADIRGNGVPADHPDVSALAAVDGGHLYLMVWHYLDDDLPGPAADVTINVTGVPWPEGAMTVTVQRIDADHADSYAAWRRMGSPNPPSDAQRAALVRASGLASEALPAVVVKAGKTDLRLSVPRQGVALVTMSAGKP